MTQFPEALDAFVTPQPTDKMNNPRQTDLFSALNSAVTALQEKVGIDGSADVNSLDYKVAQKLDASYATTNDAAVAQKLDAVDFNAFTATKDQPGGFLGISETGTITAIVVHRTGTANELDAIVLAAGEIAVVSDGSEFRIGDGVTLGGIPFIPGDSGGSLSSVSSIFLLPSGSASTNGNAFKSAYTAAKALTPNSASISSTNRASLVVFPGNYDIGSGTYNLDGDYVDVIGLGGSSACRIISSGIIRQTANEMTLRGFTLVPTTAVEIQCNSGTTDSNLWEDIVIIGVGPRLVTSSGSTLRGTYRRIRNTSIGTYFFGSTVALSTGIAAIIEDCEAYGTQCFGTLSGVSAPQILTSTGVIRRFQYLGSNGTLSLRVEGRIEDSNFGLLRIQRLASTAKIYRSRFAPASGASIDHNSAVTCAVAFCLLKANGGAGLGANVTNSIETPYNVVDDDI